MLRLTKQVFTKSSGDTAYYKRTTHYCYSEESWAVAIKTAKEYPKHKIDDKEIWLQQDENTEVFYILSTQKAYHSWYLS